jgi:hypothetical protein
MVIRILERLAARPLVRHLTDALMTRYGRRRTAYLDRTPAGRLQRNTLQHLVRQARHTRFGRDHDFGRIRTVADFQERVPIRDYEAFWLDYWSGSFPYLDNVTWPGRIPYFALSSGTTSGTTKYVPISRPMLASNQRAALTTLGLFLNAHPRTPLFAGQFFFLGGSTDLTQMGARNAKRGTVLAGDLSGITVREASSLLGPFTFPPAELALVRDWEQKMTLLAQRGATLPITMVGGIPSWMLVLFERLLRTTGRERIAEVWPQLQLVLHGGTKFDPYRDMFRRLIGSDTVRFQEVYPASEGYVAAEDPRHGLLRLLPDHGIFFEFVPLEDLNSSRPSRHTVDEIEPGVQYAVVVTTCGGLWSYQIGDTVCFERRDPPLLRFTGRTKYFLSAFGEHLISEEVERAVTSAATATGAAVVDFHVGPVFPETPAAPGRHRYLVEFAGDSPDCGRFSAELDEMLGRINEDYAVHRLGDMTMLPPEVRPVRRGGFAQWMKAHGKLGGQHKVPRMDNSGKITAEMSGFFESR